MKGEIRAVPTADGSRLKCSEVLDLGRTVRVKSIDIYRDAYVIDAASKTFGNAAPLIRATDRTAMCSPGWQEFDGRSEMILAEWECRFPPTKDVYVIVSLAIVRLSDGRDEVCRFRPLMIANGTVLSRDEEIPEEKAEAEEKREKSNH